MPLLRHGARASVAAWIAGYVLVAAAAQATPTVIPGFTIESATPGANGFSNPTDLAFLPDGRMLVAEKRGTVRVVVNGVIQPTPMWDGQDEVLNDGDRGLLGIAVDPHFQLNHRVYFYYTVDPDPDDGGDTSVAAYTRLVRYETSEDDSNVVDSDSRTILLGRTWRDGIASPTLSHAVDDLHFGEDGSLLLSHGDGAHFDVLDAGGLDPAAFGPGRSDPNDDIGAFRAQDPSDMDGKVLRINPETGFGYASNPFVQGDLTAPRARVWAYGFRNPFRFCIRPGTGSADTSAARPGVLYQGDVGLNTWEEVNVIPHGGMNFGWPCREGPAVSPLVGMTPSHNGCDAIGTAADPASPTEPLMTWSHVDSTRSLPFGLVGNCTAGGVFYTGGGYPAQYRGRYFFGDYAAQWLKVATVDSLDRLVSLQEFAGALDSPVSFAVDPISGDIFYASVYTGQVRRIRYVGGEAPAPPVAFGGVTRSYGVVPFTTQFSSIGSYDPQGGAVQAAWSFGDGTGANGETASHTFTSAGARDVILTIASDHGTIARDTLRVVALASPARPAAPWLDRFDRADAPLAAPWVGSLTGLAVQDSALVQSTSSNYAIWNGATFGPDQEVWKRFESVTPSAPEHDLLLDVQGKTWTAGCIQTVWSAATQSLVVNTYTPGVGFTRRGGPWRNVTFAPGDTLSARVYSSGWVEVARNDSLIGAASIAGWPYATAGGRVGLILTGAGATRIGPFGGGPLPLRDNTPPHPVIVSPHDGDFYATGVPVVLRGGGVDAEDPPGVLTPHWDVTLHHNNHYHPSIFGYDAPVDSFVPENHDDGTGVSLLLTLSMTDRSGLRGDSTITIWPEIDLAPSAIQVVPAAPNGAGQAQASFAIRNLGRMPSLRSRWMLTLDGAAVAQGDTLVAAGDSVRLVCSFPTPPEGPHLLRAVVDTLGVVRETREDDNVALLTWNSVGFPSSRVVDAFERPDGALAAPWIGSIAGLRVHDLALEQTRAVSYAIWNGATFAPDQEAFVRFDAVTASATEQDLLLAVQGPSWTAGCVQVIYDATRSRVAVNSYAPAQGWVQRSASPVLGVRFQPGDQFGARLSAAGVVSVFQNGVAVAHASVAGWPFVGLGGRIGLLLNGASASRFVDFGGGDTGPIGDTRPHAHIDAPADGGFYAPGTIALRATAADAEDSLATLRFRWRTTLNGAPTTRFTASDSIVAPGPTGGTPLALRLTVTDSGGLADTAQVVVRPAVDVAPGAVRAWPPAALGHGVTLFSFPLYDRGPYATPPFHWALLADGASLAAGDTTIAAGDSVTITRSLPALPVASHLLRVVADTLGAIPETDETNDAWTGRWDELAFPSVAVLDSFARPDGAIGTPWVGQLSKLAIRNHALVAPGGSAYAVWNAVWPADQDAFVVLDSITALAPEHDLLMAVQGTSWTSGAVQIVYAATQSVMRVNVYTPTQGWTSAGGPWRNQRLAPGDTLGGRVLADGRVQVFHGHTLVGEASLASWPFQGLPGRIGLLLNGATTTRVLAFGGGALGSAVGLGAAPASPAADSVLRGHPSPSIALRAQPAHDWTLTVPNPIGAGGHIALDLPRTARVGFTLYDVAGRAVWRERERTLSAGHLEFPWPLTGDGAHHAQPGIYILSVTVDGAIRTRRVAVWRSRPAPLAR